MKREKAKEKYDKMKNETPEKYILNLEKMKICSKKAWNFKNTFKELIRILFI